jgi:hypothetical protein
MRFLSTLALVTGLAAASPDSSAMSPSAEAVLAVPVLKADAVMSAAVEQVRSASPKLGYEVPGPVISLEAGLSQLQKYSKHPIVAMAESEGWFFYATSAVTDGKTGEPLQFISGYAIKRGGCRVIGWSVW